MIGLNAREGITYDELVEELVAKGYARKHAESAARFELFVDEITWDGD